MTMNPLLSLCFFCFFIFLFPTPSSANVTISISPKTLSKSGDKVVVSWCGVSNPSPVDWLGVYSPPDSSDDNFLGYLFLNSSSDYLSGSGHVSLPLPNLRHPYQFRLFRFNESQLGRAPRLNMEKNLLPATNARIASSPELSFKPGCGPEQVHLSMTMEKGEMRVMFVTEDAEKRFVRYGRKEAKLSSEAAAHSMTYTREDMCHAPANASVGWREPGWIHDAVMTHLKGGERYYYQVGSDSKGWSKVFSFVSKDEDSDKTIAFLFGDMGTATPYTTYRRTQPESVLTMKWILRDIEALGDKPAFISHLGDISYARGYSWLWDHFFTLIEPVASRVPYHICVGNHDYDWPGQPWKPEWAPYKMDCGGECGVPYSLKFNMPGNYSLPTGSRAPATRNLFYSHDMGSVHFLYISTETNFLPGSHQYNFIKSDLESLDRKKTPFVVVQGHRPMYTSSQPRGLILRSKMIEHLEPLFVDNKVTLILWGHVHRYERFCPLKNYTCGRMGRNGEPVDALPVHIVIGMGGQDWQPTWETRPSHPYQPVFPQPSMSMYRTGELGYTRIVANEKKMTFSYVGNHDGQVHDRVKFKAPRGLISRWGKPKSVSAQ